MSKNLIELLALGAREIGSWGQMATLESKAYRII